MKGHGQRKPIRFGTSGWRAIIADEFTFENVRLVSRAIAAYVKQENPAASVLIGYDTRFLSREFAKICADVFAQEGIHILLSGRDVPTPVIAYHIIAKKQDGGINFTASHNPPEYNGIKFSTAYGGPAPKSVTSAIEKNIAALSSRPLRKMKDNDSRATVKIIDLRKEYLNRIKRIVDIDCIKKARLKIAVDCMYGTSRGYLDAFLQDACREFFVFNNYLNPLFGGFPPEPDKAYIKGLIAHVQSNSFHLGLACDGDADRFGIVDKGGVFFSPNEVFTLLFYYLLKTRKKTGCVARTLATTHMIDAIAEKEGMEVIETPVGFKYIGEALSRGGCLIGGEESGGLSIRGHVPEKDGILACLLIAEMVARGKKTLREMLGSLYERYGYYYSRRKNLHLSPHEKDILLERFKALASADEFGGLKIKRRDLTDGYKLIFDHDYWVMFRPSGTEPVVRCYYEAASRKKLTHLKKSIDAFVKVE